MPKSLLANSIHTYLRLRFGPELVFWGQVHAAEENEPENKEAYDSDTHHIMKVSPVPGAFLAASGSTP
jgi:hypothetical protein